KAYVLPMVHKVDWARLGTQMKDGVGRVAVYVAERGPWREGASHTTPEGLTREADVVDEEGTVVSLRQQQATSEPSSTMEETSPSETEGEMESKVDQSTVQTETMDSQEA